MKKLFKRVTALGMSTLMIMSIIGCGCSKDDNKEEETTKKKFAEVEEIKADPAVYSLSIDDDISKLDETADISEILYGLFLEDINYAVDGGMYAELIKNRSFEYDKLAINANKHAWSIVGDSVDFSVVNGTDDKSYLNKSNVNYCVIKNTGTAKAGISNAGYLDGISIEKDKTYVATCYVKGLDGYKGAVDFSFGKLSTETRYATATVESVNDGWWKYEVELTASETVNSGVRFNVEIAQGSVAVDMVSVFPKDTYKNRANGLRADIVEYLADTNPSFLRFPGGCLVEGKTIETAYSWKDSIGNGEKFVINGVETVGDVAVRPLGTDIWADFNRAQADPYYMTYGVGFYEYFLLCEDLECLPLPVVNAGMSCPIQSPKYEELSINSEEFKQYIQDALDLVEFCKGDASTQWGAVRIAMGHAEPFELKYIGIGNEQWQETYFRHYAEFVKAFDEAKVSNPALYGDIELIVANGPVSSDRFGWDKVKANGGLDYAALVDEHYYQTPEWFLANTNRYDSYERGTTKVFLGEYAAKANNLTAALAEAAYLTGVERNADVVEMACYAPLFGNVKANQWTPDMIWFSNNSVHGSVNYYVQKMFANNVGTKILNSKLDKTGGESSIYGKIGLGTWETSAEFDDLKVVSNKTDELLYEQTFDDAEALKDGTVVTGNFKVADGKLVQSNSKPTANGNTGDVIYFGNENWTDYTMTFKAKATSGKEGFIIPICVKDKDNSIFWNYGGWGNTVSCLQQVSNGSKGDAIEGTSKDIAIKYNQEYDLKVVVSGNNIKCYSNDVIVIDYTFPDNESVYQTVSTDEETGDVIIKLVNVSNEDSDLTVSFPNADNYNKTAKVTQLSGQNGSDENTFNNPDKMVSKESTFDISKEFVYKLPKLSVTIIRINKAQ